VKPSPVAKLRSIFAPVARPRPAVRPAGRVSTSPVHSTRLPGNPGGALSTGSTTPRGRDLGPSGGTPVGWVPGNPGGTGAGSGTGAGRGTPEPDPHAEDGPGRAPAPLPDVDVRVCAESGMLPGEDCDKTVVRSYRPGSEPERRCTVCKRHVSTLADRSVPEFVSGQKRPKYPRSAVSREIEGSVTVEYTINTDGNVVGVKVTSSSGNDDLDDAAVDCVKSRKYKPAVQAGIPRDYRKRETFHFALD
ncbi:MAG: energy transducer TonB, partial [Armatimonadota bacterium]